MAFAFRVGKSTASIIVRETCEALWQILQPMYLVPPNVEHWMAIAENYENKFNLPHCIGAIDGKHVVIQAPNNSGSQFFNYKKQFSIILLAVCDANYIM